jgi:hypothetical protein
MSFSLPSSAPASSTAAFGSSLLRASTTTVSGPLKPVRIPCLFPGGEPGRPISTTQLTYRLKQFRIRPNQARSTALFQLATKISVAIVARTLGLHTDVAVTGQRLATEDWAACAGDAGRRTALQQPIDGPGATP